MSHVSTQIESLEQLFEAAVADVESGEAGRRPCNLTRDCQEARGCSRCVSGVMKGDLGIVSVDVYKSGTLTITTVGHDGRPCTVAFRGIEVTVHP